MFNAYFAIKIDKNIIINVIFRVIYMKLIDNEKKYRNKIEIR